MTDIEEQVPKVFLSYSHDDPAHKRWVADFGSKLLDNGVEVILDQWDLGLGDDAVKFMEHSVTVVDRVLMICTETYVRKADEGEGGAGYETMIVTSELVRDLGTSKFIPVIRQESGKTLLPKCVGTRVYANLSEEHDFDSQFETLLRELHEAPPVEKPPLGKNPFSKISTAESISLAMSNVPIIDNNNQSISAIHEAALNTARHGDQVAWRRLIQQAKQPISNELSKWHSNYNQNPPKTEADLPAMAYEGVSVYAPLFAIVFAGIESGKTKFNNHIALMDEILHPNNWTRSGLTVIVNLPETIAFTYQALHGAICLATDQLSIAMRMARTNFDVNSQERTSPLYQHHNVVGWPQTLSHNARIGWKFLIELPDQWPWLNEVFVTIEDYKASICAYYMALNTLEFVDTIAAGNENNILEENISQYVPLCFLAESDDIKRKGYRLFLSDSIQVREIWQRVGRSEDELIGPWTYWMRNASKWFENVYSYRSRQGFIHENLFADL